MLINIPLTIAPLIVYNLIAFGLTGDMGANPWALSIFTIGLVSAGSNQ